VSTIWQDDFESGNALAVAYDSVSDAESNATCGKDGGWGCRTVGTDSQKYFGFFRYTPASPMVSEYVRAVIDLDHAFANHDDVPAWLFSLSNEITGWGELVFLSLFHGADTGDDKTVLWIQSSFEAADGPFSATGAINLGTWQTIVLEVWFSTYAAASPYTPNADGRVKVSVDGTPVIDQSGLLIQSWRTSVDGTPNATDHINVGPMGNGDNFALYDAPAEATWVDTPNFHEELIDAAQFPGGAARCLCMLWATVAGVNAQARLVSLLADGELVDEVVGTSASVTSQTPTDATFAVALTGQKRHKLQLTSATPLTDLWCAPGAKVVP
jgi:hypothetical protein